MLAGGGAARLGGADKPGVRVGGRTLIDRVLAACSDAGTTVVVAAPRPTARPVVWAREEPAGGGPLAALDAGLRHTTAEWVVVLSADLPFLDERTVRRLLDALRESGADGAVLTDPDGRDQPLVAAYRRGALRREMDAIAAREGGDGGAVRGGIGGPAGATGSARHTGTTGPSGSTSSTGSTVSEGVAGTAGLTEAVGSDESTRSTGSDGSTGPAGAAEWDGSARPTGSVRSTGPAGSTRSTRPTEPTGSEPPTTPTALAGLPLRWLTGRLRLVRVGGALAAFDCDTWDDIAAARARIREHGNVLDEWISAVKDELGIDLDVDTGALLDLARDAAHGVARPAAPLTTFLVGYAAAQAAARGGAADGAEAVAEATRKAVALAARWVDEDQQDEKPDAHPDSASGGPHPGTGPDAAPGTRPDAR
ncbi:NTP transferase domain-containing protein [Streptomyces sp. NPDC048518]|uniref:NTP transferase domain-containing protein n=1 Tax=Streptomyces sp. NPDC048518 TaxID=3155029 RepID=UPI0033D0177D